MRPIQVVVSHPSHQGFVYRLALAAQDAGLETRLLTGLYRRGSHPAGVWLTRMPGLARVLAGRHQPGLADEAVVSVSGALPELANRLLPGRYPGDRLHDALAARWLARRLPPNALFHGAVNSCRDSLAAAKARGATTLLEVTAPPGREALLAAEARRRGEPPGAEEPAPRMREELALADRIVVQAPQVADFLVEGGVAPGRLILLPLGVDLERFRPAPAPRAEGPLRVVSVGRPGIDKGTPLLLDAWRAAGLNAAELRIAGPLLTPFAQRLAASAPSGVAFLGRLDRDALAELLAGADLFALTSPIEGGPLVVLEALASGLPCLLTEGCRSVVRDGREGRVVPADAAALAAALKDLAADRDALAALRPAARRRAEGFGWRDHARRLGGLYRALLAGEAPTDDRPLDLSAR